MLAFVLQLFRLFWPQLNASTSIPAADACIHHRASNKPTAHIPAQHQTTEFATTWWILVEHLKSHFTLELVETKTELKGDWITTRLLDNYCPCCSVSAGPVERQLFPNNFPTTASSDDNVSLMLRPQMRKKKEKAIRLHFSGAHSISFFCFFMFHLPNPFPCYTLLLCRWYKMPIQYQNIIFSHRLSYLTEIWF